MKLCTLCQNEIGYEGLKVPLHVHKGITYEPSQHFTLDGKEICEDCCNALCRYCSKKLKALDSNACLDCLNKPL